MAKKLDEQQKRCADCIYLKKVKDLNAECHVLSEDYG